MKKLLALFLCLSFLAALTVGTTGCGDGKKPDASKEKKDPEKPK